MVYKFFDKKAFCGTIKNEIISYKELAEELHKPIIRKFNKRKVCSFKGNIYGVDLAHMQYISKFNEGFTFLLSVIDVYSKYVWALSLNYTKGITITNALQNIFR